MATFKSLFTDTVGKLVSRECKVTAATSPGPHFRRLELTGDSLRGPVCSAGDKLQLLLPGVGDRTYTPFAHDPERGSLALLVYHHGDEPGARWGHRVAVGDTIRVFGPRASLPLASLAPALVVFGDETSFALARALRDLRGPAGDLQFIFEVTAPDESADVLSALDITPRTLVARAPDPLPELDRQLRAALARSPAAELVLTGNARSIQALRAALKAEPAVKARQKVKAYWSPGKRGLD